MDIPECDITVSPRVGHKKFIELHFGSMTMTKCSWYEPPNHKKSMKMDLKKISTMLIKKLNWDFLLITMLRGAT